MPGRGQPWKEGGLPDSTVTKDDVKDFSLESTDASLFKSPPAPMTGSPVPIAHGLGRVPALVRITIIDGPPVYVPPVIVEGAHTSTDVIVTGAPGWVIIAEAW